VGIKHAVALELGYDWGWDMAHIEIKDWRTAQKRHLHRMDVEGVERPLTPLELWERFCEVLPGHPNVAGGAGARRLSELTPIP
jgi:hypothetical protein